MSNQLKEKCQVCFEKMDLTDKQLKPCTCGYQICLWCWHRIMDENDECRRRCPACRAVYDKDRILKTSIRNQILKGVCAEKPNLQKEQCNSQKQRTQKLQATVADEPKDLSDVRVIQRKLVYITGMPAELASEKVLKQKKYLGQYGKIETIIVDNVGANKYFPDSGRVYVTFSREEEAVRCIQAVNGYTLDGRLLKATFGVTRYCQIWLNNKSCQKPNCSYVHHKVSPEDICSKDEVALACARRLQHFLGADLRGPQQCSGTTLPPPDVSNGRAINSIGIPKDTVKCHADNGKILPYSDRKNSGTPLTAAPRDSSFTSWGSSYAVNTVLQMQNDNPSMLSNNLTSDVKSQRSALGGRTCSSIKEMATSLKHVQVSKEPVDPSRSAQNVNIVLQRPNDSCSGILANKSGSDDARPQAAAAVGNGNSSPWKMASAGNGPSEIIASPGPQTMSVVSRRSKEYSSTLTDHLASTGCKSQISAQERKDCSYNKEKQISENVVQLLNQQIESIAAPMSTSQFVNDSRRLSGSASTIGNRFSAAAESQTSAAGDWLSKLKENSRSTKQLQLLNQQKLPAVLPRLQSANTVIQRRDDHCSVVINQLATSTDGQFQSSAQAGDASSYSMAMNVTGHHGQTSGQPAASIELPRSPNMKSCTGKMEHGSKTSNGYSRMFYSAGSESSCLAPSEARSHRIKELFHSSYSDKFVQQIPACSQAGSALCSTSDDVIPDSSCISDPPDIISWVSECLEDDEVKRPRNSVTTSFSLNRANTMCRSMQFPGSCDSAALNQLMLSPYPSGCSQCPRGVGSSMQTCCCIPPVSNTANNKSEYQNWTGSNNISYGGHDALPQHPTSNSEVAMLQPSLSSLYHDWSNENADSRLKRPQVDFSYRTYSLF